MVGFHARRWTRRWMEAARALRYARGFARALALWPGRCGARILSGHIHDTRVPPMTALVATDEDSAALRGEFVSFADSPFELLQPFAPAGDQPLAITQLIEGINHGLSFQTLLGVTGSGKTFTMANVIARLGRPAIVFAPNKTLAAQLYSEFREFFPNNAVEYFVSYYDYYQPEAYVPQRNPCGCRSRRCFWPAACS